MPTRLSSPIAMLLAVVALLQTGAGAARATTATVGPGVINWYLGML